MRKPTVTIGIPAYNEEANIGNLLKQLLNQKEIGFNLKKIIVASDASTDRTVEIVKSFKNKKIKLVSNKTRKGQAARQNEIIEITSSDILVLLNADISLKNNKFIKDLISPITAGKADFTSTSIRPLKPLNFFEKLLYTSVSYKNDIIREFNNGDNVLSCHGPGRAFSKRFYKSFSFKSSVGEDAYSYFWGKINGYKYKYSGRAIAYYRLPNNILDHERQSIRFFKSYKLMQKVFGRECTASYNPPLKLWIKYFLKHLRQNPVGMTLYLVILIYTKIKSDFYGKMKEKWEMASSSKILNS